MVHSMFQPIAYFRLVFLVYICSQSYWLLINTVAYEMRCSNLHSFAILIVFPHKFVGISSDETEKICDIQIIVVILKVTMRFFQQRPWIIGKIILIVLGSHMPNMNYKVIVCSASVELTQ